MLERLFSSSQGVDVAPVIRGALRGDARSTQPDLAAGLSAWVELLDPAVEIDTASVGMPGFGVVRGLKGHAEMWSRWVEEWEHYSWTHSNWSEVGEHVIADVEIHATGRSSGAEANWRHCQVYTFRDGKVIRWRLFDDRASAMAAIEN